MSHDASSLEDLLDELASEDPTRRRRAAFSLSAMQNPLTVPDLLRAADDTDNGVRSFIASGLARLGDEALPQVKAALGSDEPRVRLVAVTALHHMKNPTVVIDIIPLLHDINGAVRAAAADALRHYNTPEAQAALAAQRSGTDDEPTE